MSAEDLAAIEAANAESKRYLEAATQHLEQVRRERAEQPARLAELRGQAGEARERTVAEEPWFDCVNAIPMTENGEIAGMMSLPSVDGKELWGTRLAFDLADAAGDSDLVADILQRYYTLLQGKPEHLFLVFSAALSTMAESVLPTVLNQAERRGSDWVLRVTLADAARNAWATRITD